MVGKTLTGKTTLAKSLVRQLKPARTFIVDVTGEYAPLASASTRVLHFDDEDDPWRLAEEAWLQATPGRKTLIVFDEMEFYGKRPQDVEWLSKIYLVGRHWGISTIAIGKRFVGKTRWEGLPSLPLSQVSSLYVFQDTAPGDLDYLSSYLSREVVDRIQLLRPADPRAGRGGEYFKIDF